MKFYQIKSIEKGEKPARWYRLLVPSGITFSQLYVLLAYVHSEIYHLSSWFFYETKERGFQIEEFFGEPEDPDQLYDVYDAKGTYIDTFFEEGFKINQYTGSDFDLSIIVEKDAAEYPELSSPKVVKTSRAIALEGGSLTEDETLPEQLFEVTVTEAPDFNSAEELAGKLGSGTVMYTAEDPHTPEESIRKGRMTSNRERFDKARQILRGDESLSDLIAQLEEEKKDGQTKDHKILAKIDNRMLEKYGTTLAEYLFYVTVNDSSQGTSEIPHPDAVPARRPVTTEDYINNYSKEDLEIIAEEYDVILPAKKTKKSMAKAILLQLFTAERIRERLMQLEDGEMQLFIRTAACERGRVPETDEEDVQAENLIDDLLAVPLTGNRLYVTDLLRNVYEKSDKEALETERQKNVWMYKCLDIASAFYGVMDWSVLGQLYSRKFKGISRDELTRIYRRTPDFYNEFTEIGDKLVLWGFAENDYYKYLEDRVQQNKPFYIPSRKEIEEFYDKGCLLSSRSHQAMYRFLINKLGYTKKDAENKVTEIYYCINNNGRMQTVLDSVMDGHGEDGAFSSEKDFSEFAQLYMDMNNFSHVMANRGYSPNDLFHVMGGARSLPKEFTITPRGPEAAQMLADSREELAKRGISIDEERVKDMLESEKRKKIGRNEPCPCGSGKKYKNCCGKS